MLVVAKCAQIFRGKCMLQLVFALLFCISAQALAADSLPVEQIMTQDEAARIGLSDATPQQKQAFEAWMASWTRRVIEQAPSYRPGQPVSLWVQSWPPYANPKKTTLSKDELEERMKANQRIDKIKNDGGILELKDGSVWAVSPLYTYLTKNWLRGDTIKIEPSQNVLYTHLLTNINRDQQAEANLKQPPSPTGKKEEPNEYKDTLPLLTASTTGDSITLANGTTWSIAPVDMYKARTWQEHDRIRVEKADNFLYQYRLTNVDSGQVALANKG